MAKFEKAFDLTTGHEGGYANDPHDRGGETYAGISRVHHPDWSGWRRIDGHKGAGFPRNLDSDGVLQASIRRFYKAQYWDRFKGDNIRDQAIADELYDTAVNMGVRRAVRFLQTALNLLNRDQRDYPDLIVDGWFGNRTLATLRTLLTNERDNGVVLKLLNILQGAHYVDIMLANSTQERFARGWLKRA